jgi:hypothetical protein
VTNIDGIDVTNFGLGASFPQGMFVSHDDVNDGANQNHKLVPWQAIANAFSPALLIDPLFDPRQVGAPNNGYVRPQAGAQLRVPLTIAYARCGDNETPNRSHSGGLSGGSCNPAQQLSTHLTVGTTDANGFTAQSGGFVKLTVCSSGTTASGACSTPAGMTAPDVRIEASVTDVRCKAGVSTCQGGVNSDYTGELQVRPVVRMTDKHNSTTSGGTGDQATVADGSYLPVTVLCAPNAGGADASAIGGTCSVLTRANAVAPGALVAGKRGNWELRDIRVFDGGADGDVDTGGNTLFQRQGVFVP